MNKLQQLQNLMKYQHLYQMNIEVVDITGEEHFSESGDSWVLVVVEIINKSNKKREKHTCPLFLEAEMEVILQLEIGKSYTVYCDKSNEDGDVWKWMHVTELL